MPAFLVPVLALSSPPPSITPPKSPRHPPSNFSFSLPVNTAAAASLAALLISLSHPYAAIALPKLPPLGPPSINLPSIPVPSLSGGGGGDDSAPRDTGSNTLTREEESTVDDLMERMEAKKRTKAAQK